MAVSTPIKKDNKPRHKWAGKLRPPKETEIVDEYTKTGRLIQIVKNISTFCSGGWQAVLAKNENVILDKEYKGKMQRTLGEYLSWYLTDKSFLHSIDWMGIPTRKMLTDIWVYQEIIHETKPDLIIEIGSFYGGSTLFLAQMLELIGGGEVLSIDVSHDYFMAKHPRIQKITGDCSDPAVIEKVSALAREKKVMVIHDGDHTAQAVLRDLKLYAPFVTPGMYLIVEDGVIDILNPKYCKLAKAYPDGGPLKALREFFDEAKDSFEMDMRRERFVLTVNPNGYLKRKTF